MLLICVIIECPTLMEEDSVALRKSGLLKCHSRFKGQSVKKEIFCPPSSSCLSTVYGLSTLSVVSVVHPSSFVSILKPEECHNVLFVSGAASNVEWSCILVFSWSSPS